MGFLKNLRNSFQAAQEASGRRFTRVDAQATYFEKDSDCELIYVVGESNYQREISRITGRKGNEGLDFPAIAVLAPEPSNPHDANAVNVQIEGEIIGYLCREDAAEYSPVLARALDQGCVFAFDAKINAFPPEEAETPNAGVTVWVPSPEILAEEAKA